MGREAERIEPYATTMVPLRGREAELTVVRQMLARLGAGQSSRLVVEGAAGIGKSRLLAHTGGMARDLGMMVSESRADEVDVVAPLASLLTALAQGEDPVVSRDELRALERPGDQRFWLLEELAEILELRSRRAPLVVSLDDFQWADDATVWAVGGLLNDLVARVASVGVVRNRSELWPSSPISFIGSTRGGTWWFVTTIASLLLALGLALVAVRSRLRSQRHRPNPSQTA